MIRHEAEPYRWDQIELMPYKETGSHFKSITRQTLFTGDHDLPVELRYFEVAPGGHSTLERHEHAHLVVVIRGCGKVLVGQQIASIGGHDLVEIPPLTWHQFQATGDEPLGFLCVVSQERDRPERPSGQTLDELMANPWVAEFIRV